MLPPESRPGLGVSFRAARNNIDLVRRVTSDHGREADFIGIYDELGDLPPWVHLYEIAQNLPASADTMVGPVGVAVPKHKSMVDVVGYIAWLSRLRSGKVFLGLVPGARMEKLGLVPASVDQMREAVESSLYLWRGERSGYKGNYFSIESNFAIQRQPDTALPILFGVWGRRLAEMAGEIADAIEIGSCANPAMVPVMRERIKSGAERVGRDMEDIAVILGAVTVVDENRSIALQRAKKLAVYLISNIGRNDVTVVRDFPEELGKIEEFMMVGDRDKAIRWLPDEMLQRFVIAGTPNDIIRQAEKIFAAGASGIEFGTPHHATSQIKGVELLVKEVFPYFRNK